MSVHLTVHLAHGNMHGIKNHQPLYFLIIYGLILNNYFSRSNGSQIPVVAVALVKSRIIKLDKKFPALEFVKLYIFLKITTAAYFAMIYQNQL